MIMGATVNKGRCVLMKKRRKEKLMDLLEKIKESLRQRKSKTFEKLVEKYFSILKPVAVDGGFNPDYRFHKYRTKK